MGLETSRASHVQIYVQNILLPSQGALGLPHQDRGTCKNAASPYTLPKWNPKRLGILHMIISSKSWLTSANGIHGPW